MRQLLRHPLTWLVAGEAAIVGTLVGAAWYVFTLPSGPPPLVVQPLLRPEAASPSPKPVKPAKQPSPAASPSALPVPVGLPFPIDLGELNRDGSAFEVAEAAVVRDLETAMLAYVDRVVLPAVLRAESESAASSAASKQSPPATRNTP